MPKPTPRAKAKLTVRVIKKKLVVKEKPVLVPNILVPFSFQNVDYQIDLEKSKVYRRFIEVEKSRTNSIITAYRTVSTRPVRTRASV